MLTLTFSSIALLGMFGFPGAPELMIVLLIALVLFGGAKLPSLMRNLGKSANEFKRGMAETGDDADEAADKPSEKV
ncbi:sec-independent protein translocase protein TatA [Neorhodopirellula lusitana]|uniref:Sec-independent protein translocase protein TatA n=1 Tax=Neorhodopirellula lusitana TaxID=445327 RepID=A0ABY1PRY1_9BACT|nr:twin-arginine translocase TatA/TatE family subunit [Neorhodopirellula lusitana]SMP42045.1 sec-independent protein translocase protein TatA [Neorhodopirellula lusitana]